MTIKEFIEKNYPNHHWNQTSAEQLAIDFAKFNVKAALQKASEEVEIIMTDNCDNHTPYRGVCIDCGRYDNPKIPTNEVNKKSILESYPLKNIK
jgi:hypothetical protein